MVRVRYSGSVSGRGLAKRTLDRAFTQLGSICR
jgi:hypothetical protein